MELKWDLKVGILDKLGLRNLLAKKKINLAILKKKLTKFIFYCIYFKVFLETISYLCLRLLLYNFNKKHLSNKENRLRITNLLLYPIQ